ncbi:MAG: carotenoid biosynthesis protein [Polaribacter sp.]|jgi:bisanhydrobacterioruberin hydratase
MKFSNLFKHKYRLALGISLLFHISAIIGLLFTDYNDFFIDNTPLNLIISMVLILYTQQKINKSLWFFFSACVFAGFTYEVIGINTGILFGDYKYSSVMGYKIFGVPVLLGVLWFTTMYCVGSLTYQAYHWFKIKYKFTISNKLEINLLAIIAAFAAVFLDLFLEPVAIKLNFWQWYPYGKIPIYNYVCWFFGSLILQYLFVIFNFNKQNKFAMYLFTIQLIFFITISLFYK